MSVFCTVDDKHVPVYRIMWVSAIPHFCGASECRHEGDYEIRLEHGEAVWANQQERDAVLEAIELWQGELEEPREDDDA